MWHGVRVCQKPPPVSLESPASMSTSATEKRKKKSNQRAKVLVFIGKMEKRREREKSPEKQFTLIHIFILLNHIRKIKKSTGINNK